MCCQLHDMVSCSFTITEWFAHCPSTNIVIIRRGISLGFPQCAHSSHHPFQYQFSQRYTQRFGKSFWKQKSYICFTAHALIPSGDGKEYPGMSRCMQKCCSIILITVLWSLTGQKVHLAVVRSSGSGSLITGVTFLPLDCSDCVFTGYDNGLGCVISHGLTISGILSHVWYWLIPRIAVLGLCHTLG